MVNFTILIISHGQEDLLRKCLNSLEVEAEVIIVSNGKKLSEEFKQKVMVIETDVELTPGQARNLGISHAQGEWIFFLGEEASLGPHYWDILLPLLELPKVDVLGGPALAADSMGMLPQSLHIALSSPLCTGTTFARYQSLGRKLILADEEKLTGLNLWVRKEVFKKLSFPEDYLKGEELLLLQKLKAEGFGIYYHPKLVVYEFHREVGRDFFWEGFYRSRLSRENLGSSSEVFWLPSIFVIMHLSVFLGTEMFYSLFKIYGGIIVFVSLGLSMKSKKPWLFALVAFFHYFVVFIYGVGFLAERFHIRKRGN